MTTIKEEIIRRNCDAYVMYDSAENSDMRYLSHFNATDPYIYICTKDGKECLVVSSMEELRAKRESPCEVFTRTSLHFNDYYTKYHDIDAATAHFLAEYCGNNLLVPYSMPVGFSNALAQVATIKIDKDTVQSMRTVKNDDEIEKIRTVQRKNEDAVHLAIESIRKAEIDENGGLILEGSPLTSERIKYILHDYFFKHGLDDRDTIISCGYDTALPHAKGTGQLMAHQPIVMDVFPRDLTTGFFADMTRTVSKGEPSPEIMKMYETVHEAKELAASILRPGITGAEVHNAVVSFFNEKNYETAASSGFIHGLGHGVGLAIHEMPSLSPSGGKLEPGNIVTIEPGLYYPELGGGVRLEDMGVITEDGFDRFTMMEEELIIA